MTEWIISGNLKYYNFADAFHDLKKIDWRQHVNYEVGDIVYIYSSGNEQMIRFKCKVNKVNIKDREIDDLKYNIEGKYDEPYNKYAEFEMIDEYDNNLYSRKALERFGFKPPQGAIKVSPQIKEYLDIVTELLNTPEMNPDKHDGSYELMRSVINAYENTKDLSVIDYNDLNLVYAMVIGTWRQGIDAKKKMIEKSNLPIAQKDALSHKLDEVWKKAENRHYENSGVLKTAVGMFGTGFFSFVGKTDDVSPRNFIEMCISIAHMHDSDEQIYRRCEGVVNSSLKGLQAASVSIMLHCLRPTVFPILNGNEGYKNIYRYLGAELESEESIATYIKNCRSISKFRDNNFTIKNYRIFDNAARMLDTGSHTDINYLWLLDYLENNRDIPYSDPDSATDEKEKERLLSIKSSGQQAVAEMQKIAKLCAKKFSLKKCEQIRWLDGSNTRTKNYLWAQLKYKEYADRPESITVYVDMSEVTNHPRFRFSLELKNDNSNEDVLKNYHRHFDIPIDKDSSLIYVSGSNKFRCPKILNEDTETIKLKIDDGTYDKVQVSRIVEYSDEITNDEIEAKMIAGISELIPYYEYVLGINKPEDEYWPSKEEFDPGITSEQWGIMLKNKDVIKPEYLDMLYKMLGQGGESTCAHLEEVYGGSQSTYNAYGRSIGQAVMKDAGCSCIVEDGITRYYTIPFVGRKIVENGNERYSWKMRDELKEALEYMSLTSIDVEITEFDKNMILYGPPGTGKTYNTVNYAVAICEGLSLEEVSNKSYDEVFDEYNKLKKDGRIAFTTFHQSYGYEEFIEGIKPVLDANEKAGAISYTIKDGVFKEFCKRASKVSINMNATSSNTTFYIGENAKLWCAMLGRKEAPEIASKCFEEGIVRIDLDDVSERITEAENELDDKEKKMLHNFQDEMKIGDLIVSRVSATEINGVGIVTGDCEYDTSYERSSGKRNVNWIYKGDAIDIGNLNGQTKLEKDTLYPLNYISINELLKRIPGGLIVEDDRPYVFIVDEINRGNISKIFGELITLIEPTKRKGAPEATEAILPYSNESFSVPSNVYIIGTMNTADRSTALMDTALRRRFQFIEMMSDSDVLRNIGADIIQIDDEELDVAQMLDVINQRIEYLYDREHTIGHAFFTGLATEPTIEKLAGIFRKSVIPLLQEYFYEDYSKIMMVLGDNGKDNDEYKFIIAKEIKPNSIFRGDTSDIDIPDYAYEIQESAFMDINSYIEIIG